MKNIILILSVLLMSSVVFAQGAVPIEKAPQGTVKSKELSWVDEQIRAIIPARKGTTNAFIDTINQPFIFVVKKEKAENAQSKTASGTRVFKKRRIWPLRVTLIINSKAFINGRWYGINDKVRGYKVTSIDKVKVSLVKNKKVKILSIKKDNKNIKINTK
ncbi:hypothetical protein [Sulfurimonas sp. HSL-1716]|uniref:hypothetical protein n=1 Tax=Hydrocurvibacter sulfurireducens TaxID=3131937 RepID=UPI0031F78899